MDKKIIVPVTLQKDARLGDLDVDVVLEVSCSLSHEIEAPAPPLPPPAPPAAEAPLAREPVADEDSGDATMAVPLPPVGALKEPAIHPRLAAKDPSRPAAKPPAPRPSDSRVRTSRKRIDSVLDELLKKRGPKR